MAYNTHPCNTCKYFDPILRGTNPGYRATAHGWCAKKSVYPAVDEPGTVTPPSVDRVDHKDKPASPYIVRTTGVVDNCLDYSAGTPVPTKARLLEKVRSGK